MNFRIHFFVCGFVTIISVNKTVKRIKFFLKDGKYLK